MHPSIRGLSILVLSCAAAGFAGCGGGADDSPSASDDALSQDAIAVDGVPSTFDHDDVVDDAFYQAQAWASADEIQAFFEKTSWGTRSWLADVTIHPAGSDQSAPIRLADAIAQTAHAHGINPMLLVARMQVEKSLVRPSAPPADSVQQFALGCHKVTADHPNGLDPSIAPLELQLECGAQTLDTQFKNAASGANSFPVGKDATTQDGVVVHPMNRATSALYAYTPIEGTKATNGNWLVWNLVLRFARTIENARR